MRAGIGSGILRDWPRGPRLKNEPSGGLSGALRQSMQDYFQRLLVPVNGSDGDLRALSVVGQLVHKHPTTITLIYVVEVLQSMPLDAELPAEIERGERVLGRAEQIARTQLGHKLDRVSTELLQARSAGSAIVDEAIERRVDAIVMATTLRNKHGRATTGETTAYVFKNAPCEVIVIRQALPEGPLLEVPE